MNQRNEEDGEAIVLEYELADAPEKVWRALTERELLAAWLMPNDFRAELGADFHFQPPPELESEAPVACKVLAIEPPRFLHLRWREQGASEDGTLSFELSPTETGGTRLVLTHRAAAERAPGQQMGALLHLPARTRASGSKPPECLRWAA